MMTTMRSMSSASGRTLRGFALVLLDEDEVATPLGLGLINSLDGRWLSGVIGSDIGCFRWRWCWIEHMCIPSSWSVLCRVLLRVLSVRVLARGFFTLLGLCCGSGVYDLLGVDVTVGAGGSWSLYVIKLESKFFFSVPARALALVGARPLRAAIPGNVYRFCSMDAGGFSAVCIWWDNLFLWLMQSVEVVSSPGLAGVFRDERLLLTPFVHPLIENQCCL